MFWLQLNYKYVIYYSERWIKPSWPNSPPSRRCPQSRVCLEECRRQAASKWNLGQDKRATYLFFWLDLENAPGNQQRSWKGTPHRWKSSQKQLVFGHAKRRRRSLLQGETAFSSTAGWDGTSLRPPGAAEAPKSWVRVRVSFVFFLGVFCENINNGQW